ncbi:hypothetical protein KXV53_001062 [Aspergillus fumigatus]|nr:hypothetical protein KXX10_008152 [Aspergillus fumigatus]KAH2403789.1 hypothetical protein KXV53_001062 [Aspergillus fumigatus]KAJ8149292.1 hypothetical protein LV155_007808 [Aspergillus fumigatus]
MATRPHQPSQANRPSMAVTRPREGRERKTLRRSRFGCRNCKLRKIKVRAAMKANRNARDPIAAEAGKSLAVEVRGKAELRPPVTSAVWTSDGSTFYQLNAKCQDLITLYLGRSLMAPTNPIVRQVNRSLLSLAFSYPFLMHASLAVAFMYDRHLNGPLGDRGSLEECYHRAQSIALLNQRLRDPIEEKDKDPIWGTAAALGILTFSSPDARTPEESWPLKSSGPSDLGWLRMSNAKMTLWRIVNPLRSNSLFHVMAATFAVMHSPFPESGIDGIPSELAAVCLLNESSTAMNNPYFHAAHAVSQILLLPDSEVTIGQIQVFIRCIHGAFEDLLQKRDPVALLLLYLWYRKAGRSVCYITTAMLRYMHSFLAVLSPTDDVEMRFLTFFVLAAAACAAVPYEEYILAPATRDLVPERVYQVSGSISDPSAVTHAEGGKATFHGVSSVTYDFGRNIAGIVSVAVSRVSSPDAFIGVTFSESSAWISHEACDATADTGLDSPLWFPVGHGPGRYTAEKKHNRGAFRYLTLITNTSATVVVDSVRVNFTAAPTQNLRAYKGYFHCDDELLNRIWYAGAYTNQLCTIDPSMGNALPLLGTVTSRDNITLPETVPWWSNYTIANGSSVLTDGAKRDRLVWPGDMSIALESVAVSTYDLYSVRMALESLFAMQQADGRLPYAGKPFYDTVSYTYHLHSLIGVAYYYRFAGDLNWLAAHWTQYKRALQWSLSSIDHTGLANVTASADWLRFGMGGHNIEANSILYFVLRESLLLATTLNDTASSSSWSRIASTLKASANARLWDPAVGLYRDNETTTLHPQDGNAWALKANLTLSATQSAAISAALSACWGPYGAPAPEAGSTVSPFSTGFELQAHFLAGQPQRALDLMRRQWGFMLDDPRMTQSTFIEGYSTDGSLHYAPYRNDARISHAHGWATGPTAALMFYAAGLQIAGAGGERWLFAPMPGDLQAVEAGFETRLGRFATEFTRGEEGYTKLVFTTPEGTSGEVRLEAEGVLVSGNGTRVKLVEGVSTGLHGGTWRLTRV